MGLGAACDFHTLPLPLKGGSHGAPKDAVSQTKTFAQFLYHFLSGHVHPRPTCGCHPAPGSVQEICLEQHVRAAKTHCWSPQAPADSIIITYPREIKWYMLFFSKDRITCILHGSSAWGQRRDGAWGCCYTGTEKDHFGVATSITPD